MATNLALDDKLIAKAVKLGNHKTKKEAVTTALEHYVKSKSHRSLEDIAGTIDYYPDYDYKKARRSKVNP